MTQRTHDKIVRNLVQRLNESSTPYEKIGFETEYYSRKTGHGECDVYAVYKNNLLCFEVKSTDSKHARAKAEHQLTKDHSYFSKLYGTTKTYKFYVYGDSLKNSKYEKFYEIQRVKR